MIVLDGILAGLAHVFSGPDHLAGTAPIAVDPPNRRIASDRVGLSRGLGRGFEVAVLGRAAIRVGLAGLPRLLTAVAAIAITVGAWWCAATWAAAPFTPS